MKTFIPVLYRLSGFAVVLCCPLFTMISNAETTDSSSEPGETAAILKQVARNSDMEIALAEVGARQAHQPQLKEFCLQLQRQQIQAGEQLKPIAKRHAVSVDQSLTKKDEKDLARLGGKHGTKFDRSLTKHLISEQHKEISKLQEVADHTTDRDLKQYAERVLPQAHQQLRQTQTLA